MKLAAATVPVVAGRVTPPAPPVVRVPPGASTTVPAVVADTATLPKFMSTVFTIVIGVMMFAEQDAVADACAKELLENPITTAAVAIALKMFFIFLFFVCLKMVCLEMVCLIIVCFFVCFICKEYIQRRAKLINA